MGEPRNRDGWCRKPGCKARYDIFKWRGPLCRKHTKEALEHSEKVERWFVEEFSDSEGRPIFDYGHRPSRPCPSLPRVPADVEWVRQEDRSGCGQACLAMLLGIDYEQAVELVGTRGVTTLPALRPHLLEAGYACAERLSPGHPEDRNCRALLRSVTKRGPDGRIVRSHWTVQDWGRRFDPAQASREHGVQPLCWDRVTSHVVLLWGNSCSPASPQGTNHQDLQTTTVVHQCRVHEQ
jgi:hypothetical protein